MQSSLINNLACLPSLQFPYDISVKLASFQYAKNWTAMNLNYVVHGLIDESRTTHGKVGVGFHVMQL